MSKRIINFGVIGLGRIGKMHIDHLLYQIPRANVVAVVSDELDIPWLESRNIEHYSKTAESLIQHPEIDAFIIAVPTSLHISMIEKVAAAKKHIFCEKPVAIDPAKIKCIADKIEKSEAKVQIGYNRRFDKEYIAVKKQIEAGNIGEIHIIKITNRDPKRPEIQFAADSGGLFMDFNVHDFDMARFITGDEVASVFATGSKLILPKEASAYAIDTAVILLKMQQGAYCIIDTSVETHYGYDQQLEVFGSLGMVQANNLHPTTIRYLNEEKKTQLDKPCYSFIERYQQAYIDQFNAFIDSIIEDKPTAVGMQDALKAVEIACLAEQALQTKKIVNYTEIEHSYE